MHDCYHLAYYYTMLPMDATNTNNNARHCLFLRLGYCVQFVDAPVQTLVV